uniref:Uncharacterized protein n=1 Tax=Setaria digitata TaxID=48799 RepID=A0A915PQY2_9BILA
MFRKLETVLPPSESVVGSSVDKNTLFNCCGKVEECKVVEIYFDPLVMHTISLLQYRRKLNCYRVRMGPPPSLPAFNPLKLNLPNSEDMANEFSEEDVQMLLRKAIAVLAAHLEMESSMVYLISRIVAARIKRMCLNLNLSHHRRVEGRETAFPSALMHALRLENIRNVTELQEFYKNRVVFYHDRIFLSCTKKYEKAAEKFAPFQAKKINCFESEASLKCS